MTRRELPYFANVRDGELMRIAARVTIRDVMGLVAVFALPVMVLSW